MNVHDRRVVMETRRNNNCAYSFERNEQDRSLIDRNISSASMTITDYPRRHEILWQMDYYQSLIELPAKKERKHRC